ncbi:MAG: sugar phosphate isomerase/epimerase family protein [Pirellulales bacterium]|nr:sugar phosphate isomerase/epimerase family protein [Pirellulales bacterium]
MPAMQLGIALSSLGMPLKHALPLCAHWQLLFVELDLRRQFQPADFGPSAIRQFRKLLADYNVRVGQVSYPTRRGFGESADLEARCAGIRAAIKFAAALNCRQISTQIGPLPAEYTTGGGRLLVDVLTDLGRFADHLGVQICAQSVGQPVADWQQLLRNIPEGLLAIDFCPAQLLAEGIDPVEWLASVSTAIRLVRLQDATRGFGRGRGQLLPLGTGNVPWPELLGTLQEHNYRGGFMLDLSGSTDPEPALEQAVTYIRAL